MNMYKEEEKKQTCMYIMIAIIYLLTYLTAGIIAGYYIYIRVEPVVIFIVAPFILFRFFGILFTLICYSNWSKGFCGYLIFIVVVFQAAVLCFIAVFKSFDNFSIFPLAIIIIAESLCSIYLLSLIHISEPTRPY
eukprot:TRINITY_DN6622_c0_g1_i7.p1 TRINITY_DN6622_c0_g1~~TRINITY_DN6622_c0_g1_i7.p1  ORF type:complete len:135 (-),score=27.89 TRINITY_DN6622_c0_g1_i7:53-457(-)